MLGSFFDYMCANQLKKKTHNLKTNHYTDPKLKAKHLMLRFKHSIQQSIKSSTWYLFCFIPRRVIFTFSCK